MKKQSGRTARILRKKENAVGGQKNLLILRGPTASANGLSALRNLAALKKPDVKLLSRSNDVRPFDDLSSLEFLADKNECQAFIYTSHNKKRPNNIIMGRLYDGHVMDMIELGLQNFVALEDFVGAKKRIGSIPCFIFAGDEWDRNPTCARLRSMVLDIFGGRDLTGINLTGIDHVVSMSIIGEKILWRTYTIIFKSSDSKVPRVELVPMGPSLDLIIRRQHVPSADLDKAAHKTKPLAKSQEPGARGKNILKDELGETLGRVHMQRQEFGKLHLTKSRALKSELRGGGAGSSSRGDDNEDAAEVGESEIAAELEESAAPAVAAGNKRRR